MNAGTVTFVDGSTNLGSGTVTNGVATLTTTLAEGTHQIVATYSGTNTGTEFGISTGKYDQRVDTTTTNPASGSGAGPYAYCNAGAITTPGLGADAGAAAPYPSNIFVTNLPGTVDAVTVRLNGFSTKDQGDLLSLLVGPGGNNLDFFSLTGSNVSNCSVTVQPYLLRFGSKQYRAGQQRESHICRHLQADELQHEHHVPTMPAERNQLRQPCQWDRRWLRIHSRRPTKLQPPGPRFWATRMRREFSAAPVPAPITETGPGVST